MIHLHYPRQREANRMPYYSWIVTFSAFINDYFAFVSVVTMICVCHTPGVKHGQNLWGMELLTHGDHGSQTTKFPGTELLLLNFINVQVEVSLT